VKVQQPSGLVVVAVLLVSSACTLTGGDPIRTFTFGSGTPAVAPTPSTPAPTVAPTAPPTATPAPWQRLQTVRAGGNSPEAVSNSLAFCRCGLGSDPNSASTYRMWTELTPAAGGDATGSALLDYRRSVSQVVGWIVFPQPALDDWNKSTTTMEIKNSFLTSLLNATHTAPAITTGPLDYYPNATLIQYTLSTPAGVIFATAEYSSATGNAIKLVQ
jgi:hypothetical protein